MATVKLKAKKNSVIKVIHNVNRITKARIILQEILILKQAYLTFY